MVQDLGVRRRITYATISTILSARIEWNIQILVYRVKNSFICGPVCGSNAVSHHETLIIMNYGAWSSYGWCEKVNVKQKHFSFSSSTSCKILGWKKIFMGLCELHTLYILASVCLELYTLVSGIKGCTYDNTAGKNCPGDDWCQPPEYILVKYSCQFTNGPSDPSDK